VAPSRLRGGSLPQGTGRSFGRSSELLTAYAPSSPSHYTALFEVSRTPRASPAYRLLRRGFHVSSAPRITPALGAGEMHAPHACAYPAKRLIEACTPFGRPLAPAPPQLRAPPPPSCSAWATHHGSSQPPRQPPQKNAHRQSARIIFVSQKDVSHLSMNQKRGIQNSHEVAVGDRAE
jgi:hypothetical protein